LLYFLKKNYVRDRHFRFAVASKAVGFAVFDLKRVITPHFDVYFHLWRDGGENWNTELRKWQEEENASWQLVFRRKNSKQVSFARNLNQASPIKKSFPPELKNRIKFGDLSFDISDSTRSFLATFSNTNSNRSGKIMTTVPTRLVFSHIKKSLVQPRAILKAGVSYGSRSPQPNTMHAPLFCSCWLSEGHRTSTCGNSVWCLWCFGYGHKKNICYRRQANQRTKWTAKSAMMKHVSAALEPHADVTEETSRCHRDIAVINTLTPSNETPPLPATLPRNAPSPAATPPLTLLTSHGELRCGL
jgi:hypothetical protein